MMHPHRTSDLARSHIVLGILLSVYTVLGDAVSATGQSAGAAVVVDDFEMYSEEDIPTAWSVLDDRTARRVRRDDMRPNEYVRIRRESGNQFAQAFTRGEAIQLIRPNGDGWRWNLDEAPCLAWRWRAHQLPAGAREDRVNDTGGAVYVTYSVNFLGIPRSIKYTYSSTLPVGTVVSFRGLKVLVVSSGRDEIGAWKEIERNAADDYRRLWRGRPPDEPRAISIWSDSNTTGDSARVDFDDIRVLSSCSS